MGNVVPFTVPLRGGKSYRAELVLFEGRKRRQWAVVEREPDGTEKYLAVWGGRKRQALYMAKLMTEVEVKRQREREMLAADPLGQLILGLSPETRDFLRNLLQYEARLRE